MTNYKESQLFRLDKEANHVFTLADGIYYKGPEKLAFSPRRAMFIGAHPDDIELNAGGTINRLQKLFGTEVILAVATTGSKGTWNQLIDPEQLSTIRAAEQESAGRILDAVNTIQLGYEESSLDHHQDSFIKTVTELIRTHQPDLVVTHDPYATYDFHIDHKSVGRMVSFSALIASANSGYFPNICSNSFHFVPLLMLFKSPTPNLSIALDSNSLHTKHEAVRQHQSQLGGFNMNFPDKELFTILQNS